MAEMSMEGLKELIRFYEDVCIKQISSEIEWLRIKLSEKSKTITEMQSHIDCLKAELAEIQMNKQEMEKTFETKLDPLEVPIQKAFVLIHDTQDKYQEAYGMSDGFNMAITDLKQLAEHLLIYCNHAEVE